MVSLLGDCCCVELHPCYLKEPVVLHDGWSDYGWFYYYVYSRSTYFEVIYYPSLCNIDASLLNFKVNKVSGVTSDIVSQMAYEKVLNSVHYVSEFYAYYESFYRTSLYPEICSEVVCETYTCQDITDFYRTSVQGGFYFSYYVYQVKKYVPYDYVLASPIYPDGCSEFFE